MKRVASLRKRFFTNSLLATFVVMIISVFVIDISYQGELERSAREKLRLHIINLLSVAHLSDGELNIPVILQNPRFNTEGSGLWAVILNGAKEPIWQSLSIEELVIEEQAIEKLALTFDLSQKLGTWIYGNTFVDDQWFLTAAYHIAWDDQGKIYNYHFISAENKKIIQSDIQRFRLWLFGGFIVVTSMLLACQMLVLRFAFRPILFLEEEILSLEQGEKNALSADYPIELKGVTQNLNALIEKEYRQRERYRASMADLAHSLKTPMTIIRGELEQYAENKVLQTAIVRVDNSIEYQLKRAVISGHNLMTNGVHIKQVLDMVLAALQKIYIDKNIFVEKLIADDLVFNCDENDFMELFGNLLDNAFKFAQAKIYITVRVLSLKHERKNLEIVIEDDGIGFSGSQSEIIFERGQRLDSQGLGQGIGLAVVFDLVKNYGGKIETDRSLHGGALFKISLPNDRNNINFEGQK